uniref:fibrinogen-like protein 1-like protein n=1 Tax=Pristiophorus japonicus TaxID=55135 RepID=UPI00398F8BD4
MFCHRSLSFLVLAVFVIEKCSSLSINPEFRNFLKRIKNVDILTEEQKQRIVNVKPNTDGKVHLHRDCKALNRFRPMPSGIYVIQPKGSPPLAVYCDMNTPGGGWVVLQKITKNSKVSFAEKWSTYQGTFGDVENDYWLGNDYIHLITKQAHYEVKFVLQNNNKKIEIDYASFKVAGAKDNYTLSLGSPIGDKSHDDLIKVDQNGSNDNMMFSTIDHDNDNDSTKNCAEQAGGGWWFDHCSSVILNSKQIHWPDVCDDCQSATILIKPSFENC